jgi:hypothetical protein
VEEEKKVEKVKEEKIPKGFEEVKEEIEKVKPLLPPEEVLEAEEKFEPTLIPKVLPKRPSLFEKVFIRVIIIVLIISIFVNLFLFWYWHLRVKPAPEVLTPPPTTEEVQPSPLVPPPALIEVSATETLEISNVEELLTSISQLLEKDFETANFIRILIKNTKENKFLGLEEFFTALKVKTPKGFLEKLNDDFTLFIYSSEGTNRLGFLTEIEEKEGLADLLNSWELTIEKDMEDFLVVLTKEKTFPISEFKSANYQGVAFCYLSFDLFNFGICYSTLDDFFIWTSSGETMMKVINQLKSD